jgi:hypothetical protein
MPTDTLAPGNLPLKMRRGSTFGPISILCKNAAGTAAFDLTGYTVRSIARPEFPSPNQLDLGATIETPATAGEIKILITDENTIRNFPVGEYPYDVVLESAGVRGAPTVAGILTVEDESSRPA